MPVRNARRSLSGLSLVAVPSIAAGFAFRSGLTVGVQPDGSILTPNGRALTPAGTHIEVNDRPLGMVLSPNRHVLAVVTGSNFNPRALHLIDVNTMTLKQTIGIANSFVGVGFSPSGSRIYVGGGASNDVKMFSLAPDGTFAAAGSIPIAGAAPSGLSLSADGSRLYVALNMTHEVAVIDTATSAIVRRVPVGIYPYTTIMSADGSKVYVSNWGGKVPSPTDFTDGMFPVVVDRRTGIPVSGTVSVIDTTTDSVLKTIDVGLHPCGMALSPSGDRVYITNANSDTVSVINTVTDTVVKTLHVGEIDPGHEPVLGSSPNQPVHAARRRRQQLLHDRQHVSDDRADSRTAAEESVRPGGRADVYDLHDETGLHAVHGGVQHDSARRNESAAHGLARAPARTREVLDDHRQFGA